jgi:hypothetical protein
MMKARYSFEYDEAFVPRGIPRAFANASVNVVSVYRNWLVQLETQLVNFIQK